MAEVVGARDLVRHNHPPRGGSVTITGITISLHVAGMYGLAPVVGILVDRAGHPVAIIVGICTLAVALVVAAVGSGATGGMIAALLWLGIGWSFTHVAGSALFASTVADETRASAQGAVDALANLLGATAAFVAGPLLETTSFPLLSDLALLVLVPLTVVVIRNLAWVNHPMRRQEKDTYLSRGPSPAQDPYETGLGSRSQERTDRLGAKSQRLLHLEHSIQRSCSRKPGMLSCSSMTRPCPQGQRYSYRSVVPAPAPQPSWSPTSTRTGSARKYSGTWGVGAAARRAIES